MNIIICKYKFLKIIMASVMVLLGVGFGMLFVNAENPCVLSDAEKKVYAPDPSIEIGGPELTVINKLKYPIVFNDFVWSYPGGSETGATDVTIDVINGESIVLTGEKMKRYCYGLSADCFIPCYWGHPDWRNGWFTVRSSGTEWTKGENKGAIDIDLINNKTGTFSIIEGCGGSDSQADHCDFVDWDIVWNDKGWQITFTPRTENYT